MHRRPALNANQRRVLDYVNAHGCEPPGVTTVQVATGIGVTTTRARQILEILYTRRLVGRQRALIGAGSATAYWTPAAPPKNEEPEPDRIEQKRAAAVAAMAAYKPPAPAWSQLSAKEVQVMLAIDACGDRGVPFKSVDHFSPAGIEALHSLQRRGLAGPDLLRHVWALGVTGQLVCDEYKRSQP